MQQQLHQDEVGGEGGKGTLLPRLLVSAAVEPTSVDGVENTCNGQQNTLTHGHQSRLLPTGFTHTCTSPSVQGS